MNTFMVLVLSFQFSQWHATLDLHEAVLVDRNSRCEQSRMELRAIFDIT